MSPAAWLAGIDLGITAPADAPPVTAGWAAVHLCEAEPDGTRWKNPDAASQWAYLEGKNACRIAYATVHPAVLAGETLELILGTLKTLGGLAPGDGFALSLTGGDGLQPPQVCTRARQLARAVKGALSRTPLIRTSSGFASAGNCAGLAPYPLWLITQASLAAPPPWSAVAICQRPDHHEAQAAWPDAAAMRAELGTAGQPAAAASTPFTMRALRRCPTCQRRRDTASFTTGSRDTGICSACRTTLWDNPGDPAELDGPPGEPSRGGPGHAVTPRR